MSGHGLKDIILQSAHLYSLMMVPFLFDQGEVQVVREYMYDGHDEAEASSMK